MNEGVPLIGQRHPANAACVKMLEEQLAIARKGKMMGCVVVASDGAMNFGYSHVGAAVCELMAGCDFARTKMLADLTAHEVPEVVARGKH